MSLTSPRYNVYNIKRGDEDMKRMTEWDRYYRRRREENVIAVAKLVFAGMIVLLYVVLNILGL